MRTAGLAFVIVVVVGALAGCGDDGATAIDAAAIDAGPDAAVDGAADAAPDAPTCPTTLLTGGSDVTAQGWTVVMQGPATVSYGADHVRLQTTTTLGANVGGQLLIVRADAVPVGQPFAVEIVMQVEAVDPHNALDAGAAILGAFTAPFGNAVERGQMIYLDAARIGWADDSQTQAFAVTDGAYHTYRLAVDGAAVAHLAVDGVERLTRAGFVVNGTIAIGDQTNDPRVDGTVRIRAVTRLCP